MKNLIGIDVGGTKCAVVVARGADGGTPPQILSKKSFPTIAGKPKETIDTLVKLAREALAELGLKSPDISAIGVSCGGPLDSARGIVMSPPNLAGKFSKGSSARPRSCRTTQTPARSPNGYTARERAQGIWSL